MGVGGCAAEYHHCNADLLLLLPSTDGAGNGLQYGCEALMGCIRLPAVSGYFLRGVEELRKRM